MSAKYRETTHDVISGSQVSYLRPDRLDHTSNLMTENHWKRHRNGAVHDM